MRQEEVGAAIFRRMRREFQAARYFLFRASSLSDGQIGRLRRQLLTASSCYNIEYLQLFASFRRASTSPRSTTARSAPRRVAQHILGRFSRRSLSDASFWRHRLKMLRATPPSAREASTRDIIYFKWAGPRLLVEPGPGNAAIEKATAFTTPFIEKDDAIGPTYCR